MASGIPGAVQFEGGGPFTDLYSAEPHAAKRDARLRGTRRLVEFRFEAQRMPITRPTAFYDWLYINAVLRSGISLDTVISYDGFTDIEFNPRKSLNCQARACAQFVSIWRRRFLDGRTISAEQYLDLLSQPVPPAIR